MRNKPFNSIEETGRRQLEERLANLIGRRRDEVLRGIGKGTTVCRLPDSTDCTLQSGSMLLEGVHFDLSYSPLHHLGFKLLTSIAGDLYASGGEPFAATIGIAVPNKLSSEMVEQIWQGFDAAAREYSVEISGSELTASHQILVLSSNLTGKVAEADLIVPDHARPGELICVTGDLGAAMAGLRILVREKKLWEESGEDGFSPDLKDFEYVIQRQLAPVARKDLNEAMSSTDLRPGAAIHIKRGLIHEIDLICRGSGTGFELYSPAIPISLETRKVADEMKEDVDRYALYGGEDFEILFTLPENDEEKLRAVFDDFSVIGKVLPESEGMVIQTGEGESIRLDG